MKASKEQMEEYKAMAKASPDSMEKKIRAHLEANCPKFAGNEDRLDDCLDYLNDCAREILNSKSGEVADEVCYRICRDYFDDELWRHEETTAKAAEKPAPKKKAKAKKASVIMANPSPADEKAFADLPLEPIAPVPAPVKVVPAPVQPEPGQLDFIAALGV